MLEPLALVGLRPVDRLLRGVAAARRARLGQPVAGVAAAGARPGHLAHRLRRTVVEGRAGVRHVLVPALVGEGRPGVAVEVVRRARGDDQAVLQALVPRRHLPAARGGTHRTVGGDGRLGADRVVRDLVPAVVRVAVQHHDAARRRVVIGAGLHRVTAGAAQKDRAEHRHDGGDAQEACDLVHVGSVS